MSSIKFVDKRDRELKFEFRCLDDKVVEVDPICCFESDIILEYLEDGFIGDLPIEVPTKVMKLVNDFCVSRWETINNNTTTTYDDAHHAARMLEDFDWKFVSQQPLSILVHLMLAAANLRIKSLLNLTLNAIVVRLDGKSTDEILEIFDAPDGFTRKALEEGLKKMSVRHAWAFEQIIY